MDDEDFLAAVEADNANLPVEEPKEEPQPAQPEAPQEPERAAPAEPATPEPASEPVAPEPAPEAQQAPLAALIDERVRRQAAEDRLRQIEEQEKARLAAQQLIQPPDMFESPDEYNAFVAQQIDNARYQDRLFMSERLAKVEHGAETFAKAKEWGIARCETDPFFNAKVRQSQDPYGVVMEEWKRDQTASIDLSDFEQFKAWKQAQAQMQQAAQPALPGAAAPPNPAPSIPPKSLASAPSAGTMLTEVAQSDQDIFEEVIPKG